MRVALFLVVCAIVLCAAQEVDKKACRAEFTVQNRKQLGWINNCVKTLGYKTAREKTQKSTCVWKCILENLKMLNDNGFIDVESYNRYLTDEWPDLMRPKANTTFSPCLKIGGEVTSDEYCKGYDGLVKCLTRNFANLCKGL